MPPFLASGAPERRPAQAREHGAVRPSSNLAGLLVALALLALLAWAASVGPLHDVLARDVRAR